MSKWNWLELSCVTIPANQDANIQTVNRCDLALARPQKAAKPWPFKTMTWEKMTPSQFAALLWNYVLESVGDVVVEALAQRDAKIKSLQDELAARTYASVWQPGPYKRHNTVTYKGSLRICLADTHSAPGTSESWQLAVRKGRDGRGA